ncbi:MAG: hypothetical protein WC131_02645 [Bacilli bacterium]|jgi:hypothetical protein
MGCRFDDDLKLSKSMKNNNDNIKVRRLIQKFNPYALSSKVKK